MSKKVINIGLSEKSVERAIAELKRYKQKLFKKEEKLLKRLGKIGLKEAKVRFTSAAYDGINDVSVRFDVDKNECIVEAAGKAVAFIEFGTGVYYNPSEPYPNPRPSGVVGIGEYGKGYGKRKAWGYQGDPGTNGKLTESGIVITRGNPAAMPMWYASEEIRKSVVTIAKEVFS